MNKENTLFGIVGLLLGLIIGFMFANSVNQQAVNNTGAINSGMKQNSNMPPGHPEINGNNGVAQPEVQAAIEKAKQEPDSFEAQIRAAEMHYQIQRFDGAVEYLMRANKIKPDDYETIVNLGNAYFDSNQFEEAEKWYSTALARKPDEVNVRTDFGLTFIFRGTPNYDRAVQEFTRVLEKDSSHVQALQNLTVAYTKKGDAEKAKSTLARLESVNSTNQAIPKLREEIQKLETKRQPQT
jgi:tetratricopeptide (TPR) repeat protein